MGCTLQLHSQSSTSTTSWSPPYTFWAQEYILALCQTFSCYVFVPLKNKHSFSNNNAEKRKTFYFPHILAIYIKGKLRIRIIGALIYSCAIVIDISRGGVHKRLNLITKNPSDWIQSQSKELFPRVDTSCNKAPCVYEVCIIMVLTVKARCS